MAGLLIRLPGRKKFNRIILNNDAVQRRIDIATRRIEGESRARLAKHRKTGEHAIMVYRDRHTRVICLYAKTDNGAPMSIQFGHYQYGKWKPGLFILPTGKGVGEARGAP